MLHHISLPVQDIVAATRLYDAVLGCLGYRRVVSAEEFSGYGLEDGKDKLALLGVADPGSPRPGFHLALQAPSRAAVDAFFESAMGHGATDNGPPGLRPHYGPTYYAAFVVDLDGHHLEAVCKA